MRDSLFKSPRVTPFVECPNCGRLIEFGADNCPACREVIENGYALLSAGVLAINTQAVSLANTIKAGEVGAVIIFLSSAYLYLLDASDSELSFVWLWVATFMGSLVSLLAVAFWFVRYGRFKIGDEEFMRSKRDMGRSLMLWLALLSAQVFAFLTLYA